VAYNRESKTLLLEEFHTRKKKSLKKWKSSIDFDGVAP